MEIRDIIGEFFISIGFKLKESNTSEFFGNYYDVYTNGDINFRLISDRSVKSIDVSNDNLNWYDLMLVKALLYDEKKLNSVMAIEKYKDFLQKEFVRITKLFNKKDYLTTKKRLEWIGNERAKQIFPQVFLS